MFCFFVSSYLSCSGEHCNTVLLWNSRNVTLDQHEGRRWCLYCPFRAGNCSFKNYSVKLRLPKSSMNLEAQSVMITYSSRFPLGQTQLIILVYVSLSISRFAARSHGRQTSYKEKKKKTIPHFSCLDADVNNYLPKLAPHICSSSNRTWAAKNTDISFNAPFGGKVVTNEPISWTTRRQKHSLGKQWAGWCREIRTQHVAPYLHLLHKHTSKDSPDI